MKRKVLLVELNVNKNVFPLASGYLKTYACLESEVRATCAFSFLSESLLTHQDNLLKQLTAHEADIYAFSCYVWNMKLVRRLIYSLRLTRPQSLIILGGPQVDGHGARYLESSWENALVVNGEGERTFRSFLLAFSNGIDIKTVRGLTFYRDKELINTGPPDLIEDINLIPSPFLSGVYDSPYSTTVWETNRGCPYACTFCYWGKGEDRSVRKFDIGRLRNELEWMARKSVCNLHIGDANWGLFERDVELSREIARCKERFGAPLIVTFSAAKAKVERSSEIAAIFHTANIVSAQSIGIQSTTEEVLRKIRRKNIKLPILMEASREMERRGVSTYTELIWPLPGENFDSFKKCLTSLCSADVTSIIIYPALLLHSTPMEEQVDEYDITTTTADDDISELQLIMSTRDVTAKEMVDGVWLSFAVYCLYNARTLRYLGRYLNGHGILSWAELFWSFAQFFRAGTSAAAEHWAHVIESRSYADYNVVGKLIHLILHEQREDYLRSLVAFVHSQAWWSRNKEARVLFEADLVNCPYVYSNTKFDPLSPIQMHLDYLSLSLERDRRAFVRVNPEFASLLSQEILGKNPMSTNIFEVSYQDKQFPFMLGKSLRENFTYVFGMILRSSIITPQWRDAQRQS